MSSKSKTFKTGDFKNWERFFRANFFNSLGGYKSLNLMATVDEKGKSNLAPFFSVQHIGANPPLLSIIFRPLTVERHSLENFRNTGFATLNSVHSEILEAAHQSSAKYDRSVSEFEAVGLSEDHLNFPVPFVKESRLKIGIKHQMEQIIELNDTILVIASIEEVHVQEDSLLEDGLIDQSSMDNLTVNGLDSYYRPQPFKRFSYARPDQPLKELKWEKKH